jgi:hypothetical protein
VSDRVLKIIEMDAASGESKNKMSPFSESKMAKYQLKEQFCITAQKEEKPAVGFTFLCRFIMNESALCCRRMYVCLDVCM